MKAKEKAQELVSKFVSISISQYVDLVDGIRIRLAKECALIAVDEIINSHLLSDKIFNIHPVDYWNEVKQEINQL